MNGLRRPLGDKRIHLAWQRDPLLARALYAAALDHPVHVARSTAAASTSHSARGGGSPASSVPRIAPRSPRLWDRLPTGRYPAEPACGSKRAMKFARRLGRNPRPQGPCTGDAPPHGVLAMSRTSRAGRTSTTRGRETQKGKCPCCSAPALVTRRCGNLQRSAPRRLAGASVE